MEGDKRKGGHFPKCAPLELLLEPSILRVRLGCAAAGDLQDVSRINQQGLRVIKGTTSL